MDDKILQEIVEFAQKKLMERSGFCGVASGPNMAMLNSDDGQGNDIVINIKSVPE